MIGAIPALVPIATTEKNVATMIVTLDANPSSPSVKFVPFTVPTTAKNRTGIASHPRSKYFPPENGISMVSATPEYFTMYTANTPVTMI